MPGKIVINTSVGCNNQLKQAEAGCKLGINDWANKTTKKAGMLLMDGGQSKTNRPNSHPSNPIHKATEAESSTHSPPTSISENTETPETAAVATQVVTLTKQIK